MCCFIAASQLHDARSSVPAELCGLLMPFLQEGSCPGCQAGTILWWAPQWQLCQAWSHSHEFDIT